MKRPWLALVAIFTLLLLSFAFLHSQIARPQPAPAKRDTTKVERFLKFMETAKTLTEVKAEVMKAHFTPAELDHLKNDPKDSRRYRQSMDRIIAQTKTSLQPRMAASRQRMEAAVNEARAGQFAPTSGRPAKGMPGVIIPPAQCPPPGPFKIIKLDATIYPGRDFEISGTGFGDKQGTVRIVLPPELKSFEMPAISSWKDCSVIARLRADLPKLAAPNRMLYLTTSDGQRSSRPVMVKRETVYVNLSDGGMCMGPGALWPLVDVDPNEVTNCDKVSFDFTLINDYYVYKVDFEPLPLLGDTSAAMELVSSPPLNAPNCYVRAAVNVRMPPFTAGAWGLSVVLAGPRGLPYKR